MQVYLIQHGESKSEMEAPVRPLSDRGKREVESVARCVANSSVEVGRVVHSGKLRAKQTAELFAQYLMPFQSIAGQGALGFLDDSGGEEWLATQAEEPFMVMRHLPHLSRWMSVIIPGEPEKEVFRFRMGGIVCLNKSGESWSIDRALVSSLAWQTEGFGGGERK